MKKPELRIWVFKSNYGTKERVLSRTLPEARNKLKPLHINTYPQYYYDFMNIIPIPYGLG